MDYDLKLKEGGHRMFAGITGTGKSYFVGAAVEQLYDKEQRFILMDTKTVNHIGLVELPEVRLLRISPRYDYRNLNDLLDVPYILCVPASKSIPITEIIGVYRDILNYLWLHDTDRVIIAEEAHNWNKNASVPDPLFEQIAREGRGDKFFLWFVTQRLQNFSQLLWSQCKASYLWHFNIPTDVRYAGQMIPNFETINRDELGKHDVLEWFDNEYHIIKADEVTRKTPHKG